MTTEIIVTLKVDENGKWGYVYDYPKGISINKLALFDKAINCATKALNIKE